MNGTSWDESILVEDLLQNLPFEGSERERNLQTAVRDLRDFVGKGDRPLPPHVKEVALRLTRDALFDLWQGFRLGSFRGVSGIPRAPGEPPAAQIRLRERLEALAGIEATRAEMFRWFLAGLRQDLGQVLHERLRSALPTWDPRRLFVRWRGRLALTLEQAFRTPVDDQNSEHEFGLYGLHLLFGSTGHIRDQEFEALGDLMTRWVEEYPYFPELEIRDLVRALALADLTVEQTQELVSRLLAWHDLERYPAERPFAGTRAEARARARAAGYGPAMTALAVLLKPVFHLRSLPNPFGEEHRRYREEVNRRERLASALASLALQDEGCLPDLAEEIDALLEMDASVEAKFVLMDALPAFLAHPHRLALLQAALGHHGLHEFDKTWLDDLRNLRLRVSRAALEALLDSLRSFPDIRWPLQILETAGALDPQAEEWLAEQVKDAGDGRLPEVAMILHRRLAALRQPSDRLESALREWLQRCLKEDVPVPADLVRWMLGLRDKALRRLLRDLAGQMRSGALPQTSSLFAFLRTLAVEVSHAGQPNPVKLAACWLLDPDDGLGSGLPLAERLAQAASLLDRRPFDAEIAALLARAIPREDPALVAWDFWSRRPVEQQVVAAHPRLAPVLLEPMTRRQEHLMRAGADRRLALARAIAHASSPENALPLLADLFRLAVEMRNAWSEAGGMPRFFPEFAWEADALVAEVLKAVAQLEPVLPQAVALLEEILLVQYEMPEGGFSGPALAPATITQEVLPLLVNRHLAPEAIPALVALLEHDHPPEEKRDQRIWQCALQWLGSASTLSAEQQEVIWRVGYASPLILTRALALFVLGRQRPVSQQTWETVVGLLQTPSQKLYQERSAEIARLPDRNVWFILGPGDVFLPVGVAVALTAEWSAEAGLLNEDQLGALRKAWAQASADFNRGLEARLAISTHPNVGKDWSDAKGLARALCRAVGKAPDEDPDWLVRPADLARNVLLMTG